MAYFSSAGMLHKQARRHARKMRKRKASEGTTFSNELIFFLRRFPFLLPRRKQLGVVAKQKEESEQNHIWGRYFSLENVNRKRKTHVPLEVVGKSRRARGYNTKKKRFTNEINSPKISCQSNPFSLSLSYPRLVSRNAALQREKTEISLTHPYLRAFPSRTSGRQAKKTGTGAVERFRLR